MQNGFRHLVITALVWSAVGGGLAHGQAVVYDDTGETPTLKVNGVAVKPEGDGSFTFAKTYKNSAFKFAPTKIKAGEVIFTEGSGGEGSGVSDIFRYEISPIKGTNTSRVHIHFISDDGEGTLFNPIKKANFVTEPTGFVPLGTFGKNFNFEFKDSFGNALDLPKGLTVSAASDAVPEPATTASLGLLTGLLALAGAIRVRKRA